MYLWFLLFFFLLLCYSFCGYSFSLFCSFLIHIQYSTFYSLLYSLLSLHPSPRQILPKLQLNFLDSRVLCNILSRSLLPLFRVFVGSFYCSPSSSPLSAIERDAAAGGGGRSPLGSVWHTTLSSLPLSLPRNH